jgi:hypothetical protein
MEHLTDCVCLKFCIFDIFDEFVYIQKIIVKKLAEVPLFLLQIIVHLKEDQNQGLIFFFKSYRN